MIKNAAWYKKIAFLLCFSTLIGGVGTGLTAVPAYAEEVQTTTAPAVTTVQSSGETVTLTKQQAMDMAIKSSNGLKTVDLKYSTTYRLFEKAQLANIQIGKALQMLQNYSNLGKKVKEMQSSAVYKKYAQFTEKKAYYDANKSKMTDAERAKAEEELKQLMLTSEEAAQLSKLKPTAEEKAQLEVYQKLSLEIFGTEVPPTLSAQQKYNFAVQKDINFLQAQAGLDKLTKMKEVVNSKIQLGVDTLFNGILQTQQGLDVKTKLYEEQKKEYDQMLIKVQVGAASELDRKKAEMTLRQSELGVQNLARQKENYETQLKQLVGVPMNQKIVLQGEKNQPKTLGDYDQYLKTALEKRAEIACAKMDLEVANRQLEVAKDYFTPDHDTYKGVEQTVEAADVAVQNAQKNVTEDIRQQYLAIKQQEAVIDAAKKKLESANKLYTVADLTYKLGVKPISNLWLAEVNKANRQFELDKAQTDYLNLILKLEKAADVGTTYTGKGA